MSGTGSEVLIADDEEGICFALARAVRRRGLTPHVAADGRTAVEVFRRRREHIRAVFLDVRMPGLGGLEALDELRSAGAAVPCCLMTAFARERDVAARLTRAAVTVLEKPFELAAFTAVLGTMLDAPAPRRSVAVPERPRVALAFPPRYALWADVVRGAMRYARDGRDWLVSVHQEEDVAVALAEKPDGVIGMVWSADTAEKLRAWGGPVVDTGPNFPDGLFARVGLADAAVGAVAAEHLLGLGPRHMAVVPQPAVPATELFKDGFVRRLARAGVACEVAPADRFHWPTPTSAPHLDALVGWVRGLPLPAAVFAVMDPLALRVSEACRAAGLRVPADVAVLGATNDPVVCESSDPPLSSVRVAGEAVGAEAARVLEHMMAGGPAPPERIELPPVGVAVRRSTDAAAVADPALAAALRFLRDRLADPIDVDDMVEAAGVSRSSLERRFRANFGHGPLAELLRLRVERAKQLLVETTRTLGEIAPACGMHDARRLAVLFRQRTGTTPTAFRERYRGG